MVKVLIGSKEYQLDSLTSQDLKELEVKKVEDKLTDYDYAHAVILHAVLKFNPDIKGMTLKEFMGIFPLVGIEEKLEEIGDIIGVGFRKGIGKLETGVKK
jgi:hypothetical protein